MKIKPKLTSRRLSIVFASVVVGASGAAAGAVATTAASSGTPSPNALVTSSNIVVPSTPLPVAPANLNNDTQGRTVFADCSDDGDSSAGSDDTGGDDDTGSDDDGGDDMGGDDMGGDDESYQVPANQTSQTVYAVYSPQQSQPHVVFADDCGDGGDDSSAGDDSGDDGIVSADNSGDSTESIPSSESQDLDQSVDDAETGSGTNGSSYSSGAQSLYNSGIITYYQEPYFYTSLLYLDLLSNSNNSSGGKVKLTNTQEDKLLQTINQEYTTALISSATPQQAKAKGMSGGLTPYFNTCKASLTGTTAGKVTYTQAQEVMDCMNSKHSSAETKEVLEIVGGGVGGLILLVGLGAGGVALSNKRRGNDKYNSGGYDY